MITKGFLLSFFQKLLKSTKKHGKLAPWPGLKCFPVKIFFSICNEKNLFFTKSATRQITFWIKFVIFLFRRNKNANRGPMPPPFHTHNSNKNWLLVGYRTLFYRIYIKMFFQNRFIFFSGCVFKVKNYNCFQSFNTNVGKCTDY